MYLDLSIRKILVLIGITAILFGAVSMTFAYKDTRYGATPFYASVGLAWSEILWHISYAIETSVWRASQTGSAALAFVQDEGHSGAGGPQRKARAIPVLTYHRIVGSKSDLNNVTVRNFRDQMLALKRAGWETITLKEYQEFIEQKIELPEKSFLITFDDGAKESFYPVDPLLKALGYEGVMYIIAAASETPESSYYLSPTEIKRMLKTGRWEIGSHSFDGHRPYPTDTEGDTGIFFADRLWKSGEKRLETPQEFTERVRDDLQRARSHLEARYGVSIDTFAFPLGNETGIEGAANFREGASITEYEASAIYSLGFLQTDGNRFSFNYPLASSFLAYRIHVDYDWNSTRLLQELENGLPKDLPFKDDFSEDHGWISSWGKLDLGKNNLSLHANNGASSASTFLDGSLLWDNYSFDASINWENGYAFLLADVVNSKTYNSCAFSNGIVRIQTTTDGMTHVLSERVDPRITYMNDARIGMRVHGAVIECLWNYESIIETYERSGTGGIGVQVWDPELGSAALQVSEILVRPFEDT